MPGENGLKEKIKEIREELKQNGLLKKHMPSWVMDYDKHDINSHQDFADWLQFVYLPNILEETEDPQTNFQKSYVALQANKFFAKDLSKGKLLQLLIELDSLL
ncbi:MAG TPA: hypothetical protein VFH07_03175 [Chitinophagaceae bacterium]|jgi:uncharacterized protein YqcC (DUF446 family)|nr:hypothetical protein [Chitinophagaceae bacterium]